MLADELFGNLLGSLFGKRFDCSCGRRHHIEPARVVYSPDAAEQVPAVCQKAVPARRDGQASVLFDARTREVAGLAVAEGLARSGWQVHQVLVPDGARPGAPGPVCDNLTKASLATRLPLCDLIVSVGSGVVCDLGKWLAWEMGPGAPGTCLPAGRFVVFATAASMNGYASANVAPAIDGVKTLVRARPPVAVLASPQVLRDAPFEMTAAGLGDALAKSVSSADWRLNHLLFGDYYCQPSVDLIADIEPLYLEHPEDIRSRQPGAMAALFQALLLTGAAMTMAETSAPASGGEHLISHSLDMLAWAAGIEHDLHGRQVGVGTVLTAELYRRVLAVESPDFRPGAPGPDEVDPGAPGFWGPLSGVVAEQYAQKAPRLQAAREKLSRGGAWDELRGALAPMLRAPEALRDCLARAGAATKAEHIKTTPQRLEAIFLRAHQMRPRFTILDLARIVGVMPAAGAEIVRDWA